VAEIGGNRKSKPSQVFRAADVIPPFDKDAPPSNEPDNGSEGPTIAQARKEQPKHERRTRCVQKTGPGDGNMGLTEPAPAVPEIPTFDLAENILAEHRRTAARRRKGPGQAQAEPEPRPERVVGKTHVIQSPSRDRLELHRVVAEIVARDIERLCRGSRANLRMDSRERLNQAAGQGVEPRPHTGGRNHVSSGGRE